MRMPTVHVVGAGLAGLAAAVQLVKSGANVALYEAAGQAGGRCRSYYEPALDIAIDNGNHLILSGNRETMNYAGLIGARDQLVGPAEAEFAFVDLIAQEHWTLRPNKGRLPWWIWSPSRRVPGTRAADYLSVGRLLFGGKQALISDTIACSGVLYERLLKPVLLAALNTEPEAASAGLAAAIIRETLALGGTACRPLIAERGLSHALINPAVRTVKRAGGSVQLGRRLRSFRFQDNSVALLDFGDEQIAVRDEDCVILAVPSWVAASLVPDLSVPTIQRAIVNGHFRYDAPDTIPSMLGVIGGAVEWIFTFPGRISITVSAADRLLETPREELAATFWKDIQAATGIGSPLPSWQVIKEKRATFAALPSEEAKRPPPVTAWRNLVLAGDFTATALPATIEGAIRSGFRAAALSDLSRAAARDRIASGKIL
jgi:squalene-associated FAD-dependent desaturase